MKDFIRELSLGAAIVAIAGVLSSACQFGASLGLAAILGKREFGRYVIIQTTLAMLTGFILPILSSLTLAATGSAIDEKSKAKSCLQLSLLSLFLGIGLYASAYIYDTRLGSGVLLKTGVFVHFAAAMVASWSGIAQIYATTLMIDGHFRSFAVFNITRAGGMALGMLFGATFGGSSGAVIGLGVVAIAFTIHFFVRYGLQSKRTVAHFGDGLSRATLGETVTIAAASLAPAVSQWRGNTMIAERSGVGEMGLAGYANLWRLAAGAGATFLNQALLSMLRGHRAKARNEASRQQLLAMLSSFGVAVMGVAVVMAMFIFLKFERKHPEWTGIQSLIFMALSSLPAAAMAGTYGNILWMERRFNISLVINLIWSFVFAVCLFLASRFDAITVAACTTIAYTLLAAAVMAIWLWGVRHKTECSQGR